MNTDTAGNPIPLVPAYCGRCGGSTDTGGLCVARCLEPMTPTKPEARDVEQARATLTAVLLCWPTNYDDESDTKAAIRTLLSSHERLTHENERLRGLIAAAVPERFEGDLGSDALVGLWVEARAIREAKPE